MPLLVGPSVESTGHDSTLDAVPVRSRHHLKSKTPLRENCTKKVTFHDVVVDTIVVAVDD